MTRPSRLAAIAFAVALSSVPAAGQAERVSIGASAGVANPLHGDFEFTAPEWQVAVRLSPSRLVSFDLVYGEWRHTEHRTQENLAVSGPSGPLGRIGRFEQRTRYVMRTAGLNVVLTHAFPRVKVWGGGGPALMTFARDYRQMLSDCVGGVTCSDFESSHSAGRFAVQGVAGLDVVITKRVAAFGQYGFAMPVEDPGSGHTSVMAGVRFAFW